MLANSVKVSTVFFGWSPLIFRLCYLFGAILMFTGFLRPITLMEGAAAIESQQQ